MLINRICWQNFKGLQDGAINADGHDVIVKGRNGSGKTSLAEIPAFVLFGKVTGSVKAYDNGIAPTDDRVVHAAEISFDSGDTLRREISWKGNCNSATLYINGDKVSAAEFNGHVRDLTNGGGYPLFNPFAFCELSAADQRNFLIKNFGGNDHDIFNLPEFKDAEKIFGGFSADVFKQQAKRELKNAKSDAATIPARIDEIIKQRANLPDNLVSERMRLVAEIMNVQNELKSFASNTTTNLKSEYNGVIRPISATKRIKDQLERQLLSAKASLDIARQQYRDVKNAQPGKCPTCGQNMPLQLFKSQQAEKLKSICEEGNRYKADVETLQTDLANVTTELESLDKRAKQLAAQIQAQADNDAERAERISRLNDKLTSLNFQLADVNKAIENQSRLDELNSIGKQLGRRITELEGNINLAERFQQRKIELLESSINDQFKFVSFKLFNLVITTGELKPTCEPLLNGVPYLALSSGEKLKCALDILNTLQTLYNVQMPLFIDNAEAYTMNSFVELPNQKFLFRVDESDLSIDIKEV